MKRAQLQAAIIAGTPDDIEQSFYEALRTANIEQLMACWAEEDEIVCVHPAGPRIIGSAAIRDAFERVFTNGSLQAYPESIHKTVSLACAVHHLVERVELHTPQGTQQAYVIAANVYQKMSQGWRLVAHHASPGTAQDAHDVGGNTQILH